MPIHDLTPLLGLGNLQVLEICETKVTMREIAQLQDSLSNCEIKKLD